MATSVYDPIEPDVGFRILILHPATALEDAIECSLIPSTLTDHVPYEALSYVWGQDSQRRLVNLEGQQIEVTVNLHQALCNLRLPDKTRNLWVDALCIDQGNVQERNRHVQYMKDVYANCTMDVVWLGEDSSMIMDGLNVMQEFGNLTGLDKNIQQLKRDKRTMLGKLFAAPEVWKRVWIMQEIAYAPEVQLVAGNATLPWTQIEAFLDIDYYVQRYGVPDAYHGPFSHEWSVRTILNSSLAFPQILAIQRRVVQKQGSYRGYDTKLTDVLARFRYTGATDPRDKIYALLGITARPSDIVVDYELPVRAIYTEVTKRLIEQDGNLDLIDQGPWQLYGNKDRFQGIPSWVPDFSHPGESQILFAQRDIFSAYGKDVRFDFSISVDAVLKLRGHYFDTIRTVRQEYGKVYDREISPPYFPFAKLVLFWMPRTHREEAKERGNVTIGSYPSAEDGELPTDTRHKATYEDYWRTLMTDCVRYPSRRIASTDELNSLQATFFNFLETPFDEKRDMDIDLKVQTTVDRFCRKWTFAISTEGYYCMVPPGTEVGDHIAMVRGAKTPIILRPREKGNNTFEWIGACYVHGFMDGQILDHVGPEREESTFAIS